MELKTYTKEILPKGIGYTIITACTPQELPDALHQGAGALFDQGAGVVYAASTAPEAPLTEGVLGDYYLTHIHDMLGMERSLDGRPKPQGELKLEPLTRKTGQAFLTLYNESFFAVPNSATYDGEELEAFLTGPYHCGFAKMDGVRAGIYELGFKKEHPEIGSIGLSAGFQGRGLGRELLAAVMDLAAEEGAHRCWLQVSTANKPAYALYQSVGFTLDSVLSRWFEVRTRG